MAYLGQSLTEGTRRVYNYVATASQTTFNAIYGVGAVDVYQNGVLLAEADYVATTGTTVVLGTGASVNDEITIVCHNTFSVADTVSASSGGMFNGDVTFDQNVGIGTGSPSNILHVSGTSGTPVLLERTNGSACTIAFKGNATTNNPYLGANGNDLYFNTGTSEAMRIDSSGNLLVGHAAEGTWDANNSAMLRASGVATFTSTSTPPLYANRLTSDGDIVQFRKDGSPVGSIGVSDGGDRIYFGGKSTNRGIAIDSSASVLLPSTNTGGLADGLLGLGTATARFTDLYLSGGAYLGGTTSSNKLDDYETGTFTSSTSSNNVTSYGTFSGRYMKVGKMVHLSGKLSGIAAGTGHRYFVFNAPFPQYTNSHYNMGVCTAYTVGDRQAGIVINNSSGDAYGFYVGWNNVTASQSNGGVSLSITYETT